LKQLCIKYRQSFYKSVGIFGPKVIGYRILFLILDKPSIIRKKAIPMIIIKTTKGFRDHP
jgi:hypothetical protein